MVYRTRGELQNLQRLTLSYVKLLIMQFLATYWNGYSCKRMRQTYVKLNLISQI